MKKITLSLLFHILRFALSLRYRVEIKGLKEINPKMLPRKGGILFLANHPAEIDPCILIRVLWQKFRPRPAAMGSLFEGPILGSIMRGIGGIPVPNFEGSANSYKRKQLENVYYAVTQHLADGENVLLYPAGGLKHQSEELLGGSSATHRILSDLSQEVNVVLIRTTGLWGSLFSRALTGKSPDLGTAFYQAFKIILKNCIFFVPKRKVTVEMTLAPLDFPYKSDKQELNRYLEKWFNAEGRESLNLVSYSFFKKELPAVFKASDKEKISLSLIPQAIQQKIINEIALISKLPVDTISAEKDLSMDLGLDSLDLAQLLLFMKDEFGVAYLQPSDAVSVGTLMAYAAGLKAPKKEEDGDRVQTSSWLSQENRPETKGPEGKTILESFFKACARMKGCPASADSSSEMSYERLKLGVIILARKLQKLSGEKIGIMMPASNGVILFIFAAMLAKKIPVMINWTLGSRNLESVISQAGISNTLTAWKFLDRLENIELNGVDSQLIFLEDLLKQITLKDKIAAWLTAKKSPEAILQCFHCDKVAEDDPAVILFTSGTENLPKGVPLSHKNILSNHRAALKYVTLASSDVMLGALPPFHSFGFTVTGLLPILIGMRVAFSPNPTDGKKIAQAVDQWKVTVVCLAPTFLKNFLRVAVPGQLHSLRLVVTGAEKTPPDLIQKVHELNPAIEMLEGYGITECSPILTLNLENHPVCGVGLPLPGSEILIVHPETHQTVVMGEMGLILARGPNIFKGYLGNNISSPFLKISEKIWYNTGDLGYLNPEGYLTLTGRLKRFVKIGAEMISLASIEDALQRAAQELKWPIQEAEPTFGVVASEGSKKAEMILFSTIILNIDEVNRALKIEGLSNLARIAAIHQIEKIPLLGTGKIDYRSLAEILNRSLNDT